MRAERSLPNSAEPATLRLPSLSLSLSLKISLPAKSSLLQEGWGKGKGAEKGCLVSSFSPLPPPPPPKCGRVGSRASPTPALAIGSGRRMGCRGCSTISLGAARGAPYREPRPCAHGRRRQPGRRGSAVSPTQPARPPANLPAAVVGVCPRRGGSHGAGAAWLQLGVLRSFLLARGIVRIWKTAEPADSRAGRARPTAMREL